MNNIETELPVFYLIVLFNDFGSYSTHNDAFLSDHLRIFPLDSPCLTRQSMCVSVSFFIRSRCGHAVVPKAFQD